MQFYDSADRRPLYERMSVELSGWSELSKDDDASASEFSLATSRGAVKGFLHIAQHSSDAAILCLSGGRGGTRGPADGIYPELARRVTSVGISAFRTEYRYPANLDESVLDSLVSIWFLVEHGYQRICVIGHSFGGAVAISCARYSTHARGVAALSSQTFGAEDVVLLAPRPLLVVHGEADTVLPLASGQTIYDWAFKPKRMVTFPGAGHGLRECKEEVTDLLLDWTREVLG